MAGSRLAVEVLFAEKRMKPQNHDLVSLAITRNVPVKAGPTVSLKFQYSSYHNYFRTADNN